MTKNKEEVWYCVNSKGHKIPPYEANYPVLKPKKGLERLMDILGYMVGIAIVMAMVMAISYL